jgi:uncharacterized Zn finger protein
MLKEHIEIRCPNCGGKMLIEWPTPRTRRALVKCLGCETDYSIAEAVERTVVGAPDDRDRHLGRK